MGLIGRSRRLAALVGVVLMQLQNVLKHEAYAPARLYESSLDARVCGMGEAQQRWQS